MTHDSLTEPAGLKPDEAAALQALIKSYCGIRVDARKLEFSLQRAWPKLAAIGVPDVASLVRELGFLGGRAWVTLLPFITINETYFMREPRQLEYFKQAALPGLVERRGGTALQILSAACSTGEEAYTLSMLLADAGVPARILGIDIDPDVLQKAEAAIYGPNAFRGVEPAWRQAHFEALGADAWWVKAPYREVVSFKRINLLKVEPALCARRFDAIFCRNVLIYFDRATQQEVVHQLGRLLVPGGYLFLGHSELFFDMDMGLRVHSNAQATMYQREDVV